MRLGGNRGADGWVCVAKKHRAPRAHVVDVFVTVNVIKMRTGAPRDDEGLTADSAESTHGAVHAADEDIFGALEDFTAAAALFVQRGTCCAHDSRARINTV